MVVKVAVPPESVPLPMELPPSRKVTVPVGLPAPETPGVTTAVKVTAWPRTVECRLSVTVVVVPALFTV